MTKLTAYDTSVRRGEVTVNPVQHLCETAEMLGIKQFPVELVREVADNYNPKDPMQLLKRHGLLKS